MSGDEARRYSCAVLDVDSRAALERLERERGVLPGTLMAETPRGLHFYYQHREGLRSGVAVWGEGVDLRADGGYVVAPPSVLADGRRYRWPDGRFDHPLAEWPTEQLPLRKRTPPLPFNRHVVVDETATLAGLVRVVLHAPKGQRNDTLNWATFHAGLHVADGTLDVAAAVTCLMEAARHAGLGQREIERTIASGLRAAVGGDRSG
jgi:hypothetical protein